MMRYFLKQMIFGNAVPLLIYLDDEEIVLGRQTTPFLSRYIEVSRMHASFLKANDDMWFVKDLESLNGVFVNGKRIGKGLHQLKVGDIIGLGVPSLEQSTCSFVCLFCVKDSPFKVKHDSLNISDNETDDISAQSNSKKNNSINTSGNSSIQSCSKNYQLKNSHVSLIRCDSEHFKWPSDVKKSDFNTEKKEALTRKEEVDKVQAENNAEFNNEEEVDDVPNQKKKRKRRKIT